MMNRYKANKARLCLLALQVRVRTSNIMYFDICVVAKQFALIMTILSLFATMVLMEMLEQLSVKLLKVLRRFSAVCMDDQNSYRDLEKHVNDTTFSRKSCYTCWIVA